MSRNRISGWISRRIGAAPAGEVATLRSEMSALLKQTDALHGVQATNHTEIANALAEIATLREVVAGLVAEFSAHVEQSEGIAHALDDMRQLVTTLGPTSEKVRLRLEALAARHQWDIEQMRTTISAVVERTL